MTREEFEALAATWPAADYWEHREEGERLTHTDVTEALEDLIDGHYEKGVSCEDSIRAMGTVTLYGWTRKTPSEKDIVSLVDRAVESVLEHMGDWLEWSDPEKSEPERELRAGFERVIREDLKTRHIWSCDQTCEIELTTEQVLGIARLEWPEWFEKEDS